MLSSGHYRPSFDITITDIFQDYNDPRKDTIMKRVELALEEQERRLKHQLDSNNLANLQLMLKKQQIIKKLEEQCQEKDQEIDLLRHKIQGTSMKINSLEQELSRLTENNKKSEEKFSLLSGSLKQLERVIANKDSQHESLIKEQSSLKDANERLQQQKNKYQRMISILREKYNKKIEENQYVLKIREKQIKDSFQETLEIVKSEQEVERNKSQIQYRTKKQKKEMKNAKIQCDFNQKQSNRQKIGKQDKEVQTEEGKEKTISEFIDKSEKQQQCLEKDQTLEEVRLIYTASVKEIALPTPKLTKYVLQINDDKQTQTEISQIVIDCPREQPETSEKVLPKVNEQIQVNLHVQDTISKQKLKRALSQLEGVTKQKKQYKQMSEILQKENSSLKQQIQALSLQVLQVELRLDQNNHSMALERETLTKTNQMLQNSQNELMRKISTKTDIFPKHCHFSKTFTAFQTDAKHSSSVIHQRTHKNSFLQSTQKNSLMQTQYPITKHKESLFQTQMNAIQVISPRKWAEEETEVITVIRKANNLKFFKNKRHSVTQQNQERSISAPQKIFLKRNYRKYSNSKKY